MKIGKVFGIPVYLHWSFFLMFLLIATMAFEYFLITAPELMSIWFYLAGGFVATLGIFATAFLHELYHFLVAKYYKIKNEGIFFWIWGGEFKIDEEEIKTAKELFCLTFGGPLSNLILAGICLGIFYLLGFQLELQTDFYLPYIYIDQSNLSALSIFQLFGVIILGWLFLINTLLGVANFIPVLPLDGGHMLKAVFWWKLKDFRKATIITLVLGPIPGLAFLSICFIFWGVCTLFFGLIGVFLVVLSVGYGVVYIKKTYYPTKGVIYLPSTRDN